MTRRKLETSATSGPGRAGGSLQFPWRRLRAAAALLALLPVTAACGDADPYADYCDTVEQHQEELTETLGSGGEAALLQALPMLRDLEEESPDDVADDWARVVTALEQLEEALEDAGVEPAAYDVANPPAGLTDDQRARIARAADAVGSERTMRALTTVEQQVRDVCHTPLTL